MPGIPPKKKPPTAYALFLAEHRAAIITEVGTSNVITVSAAAFEKWKNVAAEEKAVFEKRAKELAEKLVAPPLAAPVVMPQQQALTKVVADTAATVAAAAEAPVVMPQQQALTKEVADTAATVEAPAADSEPPPLSDDLPFAQWIGVCGRIRGSAANAKVERSTAVMSTSSTSIAAGSSPTTPTRKHDDETATPPAALSPSGPPKKKHKKDWVPKKELSLAFRANVQKAVAEYMDEHPDEWTYSLMVEELSETKGFENDEFLKAAARYAIQALGFSKKTTRSVPRHRGLLTIQHVVD